MATGCRYEFYRLQKKCYRLRQDRHGPGLSQKMNPTTGLQRAGIQRGDQSIGLLMLGCACHNKYFEDVLNLAY